MINTPKNMLNISNLHPKIGQNITLSRFQADLTQIPIRKRTSLIVCIFKTQKYKNY